MNAGLVENNESLHIVPTAEQAEEALEFYGTRVFMKTGKKLGEVKNRIVQAKAEAMMIENCGMSDEKIYRTTDELPDEAGYYSLIIVKEKGELA